MNKKIKAIAFLVPAMLGLFSIALRADQAYSPTQGELFNKVAALDSAVFDAFNHCESPEQFTRHAGYFSENVEFYHDTGGVTWNRKDMLANTRKNVCGHFTRELVPGSLLVYPIKDFGAIAMGSHRFCQKDSTVCEGLADFTIIWQHQKDQWLITRVLSYGHRPNDATKP